MDAVNTHHAFDQVWTSGQLSEADLDRLGSQCFAAVINLAPPDHPDALAGEGEKVTGRGMSYLQIPVAWDAPTLEQLDLFCGAMRALQGRKVWVHCAKNMRVTAFIYLYRRLVLGEDAAAARHPLREVWQPNEVWRGFIEQGLKGRPSLTQTPPSS
ncbi:MAG: phosphotyrosine protein phosphatase [Alphaproteobacteria bacterium CG_4_10_14_0_2_um_filter_63_37]|nr:MAG: phosphotyrosine protein phosphatase [Alphaproteobacteria bacterium CG_4_10_14_0_2_um_filter_63_37]